MSKIKFTNADSFLSGYDFGHPFIYAFFSSIDIFSPKGELISPHLLRCGPFEVDNHVFMGRRLASAAISAREQYKFHSKYVDTNYKNKKKERQ